MNKQVQNEFTALMTKHHARLYRYIHSLVRDLHDADDVLQRTTLVLWKKFELFDRDASFFAWACGVARFEVANFLRGRGRDKLSFSGSLAEEMIHVHVDQGMLLDEQAELLAGCIEKLNQSDQQLVEKCYADGLSVASVAKKVGRSTHSIHNSLRRIRRQLFQCVSRSTSGG